MESPARPRTNRGVPESKDLSHAAGRHAAGGVGWACIRPRQRIGPVPGCPEIIVGHRLKGHVRSRDSSGERRGLEPVLPEDRVIVGVPRFPVEIEQGQAAIREAVAGNCKSPINGNRKLHTLIAGTSAAVPGCWGQDQQERSGARMRDKDAAEALSGTGCIEDGGVAAVRGEPPDDPRVGGDGATRPGP